MSQVLLKPSLKLRAIGFAISRRDGGADVRHHQRKDNRWVVMAVLNEPANIGHVLQLPPPCSI